MKKIIFIIFILSNLKINAQTDVCLPISAGGRDLHWHLLTNSSDEFNYYNTLTTTLGHAPTQIEVRNAMCGMWYFVEVWGNPFDHNTLVPGGQVYMPEDGSSIDCYGNGICSLKVEHKPGDYYFPCDGGQQGSSNICVSCDNWPSHNNSYAGGHKEHFDYTGANLVSGQPFTYGKYFEVKFRLPNYSNPSTVKGIQESFWFFPEYNSNPNCPANCTCPEYQEFDIFEVDHRYSNYKFRPTIHINTAQNAGTSQDNIWHNIGNDPAPWGNPPRSTPHAGPFSYDIDFSNGGFHTVGFEWQFENMNIYVDGHLQTSMNLSEQLVFFGNKNNLDRMNLILSVGGSGYTDNIDNNTQLPHLMEIDYVHVYDLYSDQSNATIPSISPNLFPNLVTFVKNRIILGGAAGSWLIPSTSYLNGTFNSFIIRANDYIELNDGFETDANSVEVYMDVSKK